MKLINVIVALALLAVSAFAATISINVPNADGATISQKNYNFIYSYLPSAGEPSVASCAISIDGNPLATNMAVPEFTSMAYSSDLSTLSAGAHIFSVSCNAGSLPPFGATRAFNTPAVLSVPAKVTLISPADNQQFAYDAPVSFTFTYSAGTSGPATESCTLTVDGAAISSQVASDGVASTFNTPAGSFASGAHTWEVACSGATTASKLFELSPGRYAAMIESPSTDGTVISDPYHVFTFSVVDRTGALGSTNCNIKIDSTTVDQRAVVASTSYQYVSNLSSLADGQHTFGIECDFINGAPATAALRFFTFSKQPMAATTVTLNSPSDAATIDAGAAKSAPVTLAFTYDAGTYGQKPQTDCDIYLDGFVAATARATSTQQTSVPLGNVTAGAHAWHVTCWNASAAPRTFTIASTSPISKMQIDIPNADGVVIPTPQYGFAYSYVAGDGINAPAVDCNLYIDGSMVGTSKAMPLTSQVYRADLSTLADGAHTFSVLCGASPITPATGMAASRSFTFSQKPVNPTITTSLTPADMASIPIGGGANGPVSFSFQYDAGTYGQKPQTLCDIYIDGQIRASEYASASANTPGVATVQDVSSGAHTWYVSCWNAKSATRTFTAVKAAITNPTVTLDAPAEGATFMPSAVQFVATYNGNNGPAAAACTPYFDGVAATSINANSGTQFTFTNAASSSVGTHLWNVRCTDAGNALLAVSASRSFTVYLPGGNGISGGSGGSSGSGGTGGGAISPRQPTKKATATITSPPAQQQPSANATNPAQNNDEQLASLDVSNAAFVGDAVNLILKSKDGKPLSGVDVYIRVPNSTLSIKVTTDSLGKATFIPATAGEYSYRVAGYALSDSSTTIAAARPAAKKAQPPGVLDAYMPYAFIIFGIIALAAAAYFAYGALKPKQPEESDGSEGSGMI